MNSSILNAVWSRVKLIATEALNVVTNILTPIVGAVCLIMEVLCLPASWIAVVKKIEYWLFQAAGTQSILEDVTEKVEAYLTLLEAKEAIEEALSSLDKDELKEEVGGLLESVETETDLEEVKDLISDALTEEEEEEIKDIISGILGNIQF